jgi:NAD(P)-dependent dehydrogenase (short-subunit alcohol dehydrogenase family)
VFGLEAKSALITGGSRGIGQRLAIGLAAAGAQVTVTARKTDDLEETVGAIRSAGGKVHALALDVRQVEACRATVAEAAARMGGLDILINNAGYEEVCPSLELEEEQWDAIVDTNLKGAFFVAQAAARQMQRSGGAIINVCSLTSYVGVPTAVPYGSSKSGLLGMTRALAVEWAALGIRVNAIAPGYFRTALTDPFYQSAEWSAAMLAKIPQGRFGELEDLVGVTVFLAGDASRYITGQCLPVDGGYLASI